MEQQPQAANKGGKNNSLTIIVAVIVALVVGVSVYFITRGDSGKTDGDKKDETSQEENKKFSNPADEDAAYTIKISGKTFSYKSKLEDLEEVDLYVRDSVKDEKAKAGKYMIMFGGGSLVNEKKDLSLTFTPYNDGKEDVKLPEAKLGKVTVSKNSDDEKNEEYSKWTFYGGIHLGSTEKELLEVFGKPASERESEDYKGNKNTKYEFRGSVYQKFEFTVTEGKVTEMSWTNYGKLAD